MKVNIPKDFLKSKYRKEMWINAQRILKKLEKVLTIESAYLRGSFTTNKKRPADVDFIILLKIKDKKTAKWSIDLVICPSNKYGDFVVEDATKWMKQKYGSKKAMFIKLK
jgi:hypothetical protein